MRFPVSYPYLFLFLQCCFLLGIIRPGNAQIRCADPLTFTAGIPIGKVGWDKFPDFKLPFPVVYGAPRLGDSLASPLRHGFSHIVNVTHNELFNTVQPNQRALIWYGFATILNQPWGNIESPWGNDTTKYKAAWEQFMRDYSGGKTKPDGRLDMNTGIITVDIERVQETDNRILRLKADTTVPKVYRDLPDAEFIRTYKKDMTTLYAKGLEFIRQKADLTDIPLTTYSDVPIRNTWFNVTGNTWNDWRTNSEWVSYLVKDPKTNKVGGPFYEQLDVLAPSTYYYYDYPSPLASDYLAYMLFQIEANRAWSNKPIIPYVWMRYHDCCGSFPKFIQPFMAEATAIFPFFSGANGLWFWDANTSPTDNYAAYEYFVHGLYRLSKFADVFTGDYKLVIPKSARDHMEDRTPIWRGAVKNNKILIAAQNPYATDNQTTRIPVEYGSWQHTITLKGREVYLCQFDLKVVTGNREELPIENLKVFPNPATDQVNFRFDRSSVRPVRISFTDVLGRQVLRQEIAPGTAFVHETLSTQRLSPGLYTVIITDGNSTHTRKVVIVR